MLKRRLIPVLVLLLVLAAAPAARARPPWSAQEGGASDASAELARKRQREQLRSSVQQPQEPQAPSSPERRQLSPKERSELRRQIELQQREAPQEAARTEPPQRGGPRTP